MQKNKRKSLIIAAMFLVSANYCYGQQNTIIDGVEINGIIWATTNVGANNPEDFGNYYTWYEAQNACPAGWRLPTREEFGSLINTGSEWIAINNVTGRRFGSGNNTIFLPASGWRCAIDGVLGNVGTNGYYWSSMRRDSSGAHNLGFSSDVADVDWSSRHAGFCVRCVSE